MRRHGVFAGANRALANGFELNQGQWDSRVKFRAGASRNLFLTDTGFVIALSQPVHSDSTKSSSLARQKVPSKVSRSFLGLEFIGGNPHPKIAGEKLLAGKSNYFIGNDPTKWKRNVPHYAVVRYSDLYPGINLIVHENTTGATEYDLLTAPGADPARIQLGIRGARSAKLNSSGELVLDTPNGSVIGHAPKLYQDIDGVRKNVAGGYVLNDTYKVGFKVGAYDHSQPLMIDPTILPSYSTFLGGSSSDTGTCIAVDSNGYAYVGGNTNSTDFPTSQGAYQTIFVYGGITGHDSDVFVTKLSPDGTALVYSTYIGGSGGSSATGIAVDTNGSAYVIGRQDGGYPYTGMYQGDGGPDFVTKLNANGSQLVYSASLGFISSNGITVDSLGNAYVAANQNGTFKPYALKLSADGTTLIYQTALAAGQGSANAIAIDSAGEAFIAGNEQFPNDTYPIACIEAAVWKLSADGSTIIYSDIPSPCPTIYNGTTNSASGIGVDNFGNAYVAIQLVPTPSGSLITKLDPNGNALSYGPNSLLVGNAVGIGINAIAVDPSGIAYVTGVTTSGALPTTADAFQSQLPGQRSAFISQIDASGTVLLYSSYFGGSLMDIGNAIALDPQNNAYLTGSTTSSDFPHTGGAFQGSLNGAQNAFVAQFQFPVAPTPLATPASPTPTATPTQTATATPVPSTVPTVRKTSAPLPTRTPTGTGSATVIQTPTPTSIVTPTMTVTPTLTPTMTPTPVVGPLAIAPAQINFGRVRVSRTSAERLVRLANPARNKSPIMITSLGLESQMVSEPATGFSIDNARSSCHAGDSIARGKSCTVYISFMPPAQGASSDNLVVTGDFTNSGYHVALFGLGY